MSACVRPDVSSVSTMFVEWMEFRQTLVNDVVDDTDATRSDVQKCGNPYLPNGLNYHNYI